MAHAIDLREGSITDTLPSLAAGKGKEELPFNDQRQQFADTMYNQLSTGLSGSIDARIQMADFLVRAADTLHPALALAREFMPGFLRNPQSEGYVMGAEKFLARYGYPDEK